MKSYREIADSVFARRDAYIIEQRRKKQVIARTTVSVGSVALVSLAGFALFKNDAFHDTPLISVSDTTTTVTNTPTKIGDTTTAGDATAPTTDGGVVTPTNPTTTDAVPSQSTTITTGETRPTATTTRPTTKTEPVQTTTATQTKPTTPTEPEKVLIAANKVDNTGNFNDVEMSKNKKYISRRLKEMMSQYKDEDVVYAVIVSMPPMKEYRDDFWNSNEEWVKLLKEIDEAGDAYDEEARRLNPSWDGVSAKDIEIWTDTMRANYERHCTLIDERDNIYDKYYNPFVEMILEQQFDALKEVSSTEPVDIYYGGSVRFANAYYVEMTADAINALAERGGYTFTLAMVNQTDYSGYWYDD